MVDFPITGGDTHTSKQTDTHTHQYHDSAWPRTGAKPSRNYTNTNHRNAVIQITYM